MSAHTNDGRGADGAGRDWQADPRLLAYALDELAELGPDDIAEIESALATDASCREALDELRFAIPRIEAAFSSATGAVTLDEAARSEIRLAAGRRSTPGWLAPLLAAGLLGAVGGTVWSLAGRGADGGPDARPTMTADLADGAEASRPSGGLDVSAPVARPKAASEREGALADSRADTKDGWSAPGAESSQPDGAVLKRAKGAPATLELGRGMPLGAPIAQESVVAPNPPTAARPAPDAPNSPAPSLLRLEVDGKDASQKRFESLGIDAEESDDFETGPALPENPFVRAADDPFSTFSIDVDTASYGRARAALEAGRMPDPSTVRVEEFINYFDYDDAPPRGTERAPFAVHVETAAAPWAPEHRLVRIGIQAEEIDFARRESANLVFLVDVSGSMRSPEKLPLVQGALATLTASMRADDRIAIVVYASAEGLVLDSTPVAAREAILQALERLQAGGSTNGGAGIRLAYDIARRHFVTGGINRVVLCTDGDFNVGTTSVDALEELVAREAATGVELTVLGFGQSSGGDARMEALSNRGNGNYAMIDSALEAQRVLGQAVGGTLVTVAKDVKIQVAWNPDEVSAFRLVGYENRMLAHADFLDDRVDAGEIGSGHHVTALYEVVPTGLRREDLASGATAAPEAATADAGPEPFGGDGLLEVRLRYKLPGGDVSSGIEFVGRDGGAAFGGGSNDLRFAAAVAAFAQRLRGSQRVQHVGFDEIRRWALEAKGEDPGGLREAFIRLVERAAELER